MYIGRDMSHHVTGAFGSKWGNPYKTRKKDKKSLKKCLKKYEEYVRSNPDLLNAVMELEGKELGCWCKPSPCHGDILIKLFKLLKERQGTIPCSPRSESLPELAHFDMSDHIPLRLTGGGDEILDGGESVNSQLSLV